LWATLKFPDDVSEKELQERLEEWLLEQIYDSSFTVLGDNSAKEGDPHQ
jgi:hypothetical protein